VEGRSTAGRGGRDWRGGAAREGGGGWRGGATRGGGRKPVGGAAREGGKAGWAGQLEKEGGRRRRGNSAPLWYPATGSDFHREGCLSLPGLSYPRARWPHAASTVIQVAVVGAWNEQG
jgi:hypothetical protein